jgi:hypothetical protein
VNSKTSLMPVGSSARSRARVRNAGKNCWNAAGEKSGSDWKCESMALWARVLDDRFGLQGLGWERFADRSERIVWNHDQPLRLSSLPLWSAALVDDADGLCVIVPLLVLRLSPWARAIRGSLQRA